MFRKVLDKGLSLRKLIIDYSIDHYMKTNKKNGLISEKIEL